MADWLPEFERIKQDPYGFGFPCAYANGRPWPLDDEPAGLIHSTETSVLPGYRGGKDAPNITVDPWKRKRYQHTPVNVASRALRSNNESAVQIEVVGYCDEATATKYGYGSYVLSKLDDAGRQYLAESLHIIGKACGIPATSTVKWMPYPASYGPNGNRLTVAQFKAYKGWLGHQHAPSPDAHGDPGLIGADLVQRIARLAAPPTPPKPPAPKEPIKLDPYSFSNPKLAAAHLLAAVTDLRIAHGCQVGAYRDSIDTEHRVGSWHGRTDAFGKYRLAADINAYPDDEQRELEFFKTTGQKIAKGHGLAIACGLYGHVPGHSVGDGLHLHIDTGIWSNLGHGVHRGAWQGNPTLPAWPVRAFQKQKGLVVDGIVGPATTKALQKAVGATPDGIAGPKTWRAVQTKVGAGVDGIPGGETFFKLGLAIEGAKL